MDFFLVVTVYKLLALTFSSFVLLDRVFGPTTTTRHVYDVAAQHVVSGAMEGINGPYAVGCSNSSVSISFFQFLLSLIAESLHGTFFLLSLPPKCRNYFCIWCDKQWEDSHHACEFKYSVKLMLPHIGI